MKINKEYIKISLYGFVTLALLILFFKIVDNFSNAFDSFRIIINFTLKLFRPFIIGGIIAYFIYRPVKWLEENFMKDFIKERNYVGL